MSNKKEVYWNYVKILERELIPAIGCTEPIAIAYASAAARHLLGSLPQEVNIFVSNNIIKNVKSVRIPHTGGMKGIEAAAAAGIVVGNWKRKLEVLEGTKEEDWNKIQEYLQKHPIRVEPLRSKEVLDIRVNVVKGKESASVHILKEHTNIVYMEKNGESIYVGENETPEEETNVNYGDLNLDDILTFADTVDLEDIRYMVERQIKWNYLIAEEGIRASYGAEIGRTIMETAGNDPRKLACAMAAAGSDARMSGCEMPVVIVGGSGNQGITASVPIIVYAKYLGCQLERLIRAVVLSDLLLIYQRSLIGRLSAYCGAVNAGCAAAAGIAYLEGETREAIVRTLINSLAVVSGIICDGAKPSCAAKIVSSIEAGLLGYDMNKHNQAFHGGEGIVTKDADRTIHNIGVLGKEGMHLTDEKIIEIMMTCSEE